MDLVTELLVSAREADVERTVRARGFERLVATCRRRLFGLLPVTEPCEPRASC